MIIWQIIKIYYEIIIQDPKLVLKILSYTKISHLKLDKDKLSLKWIIIRLSIKFKTT